MTYYAWIQKQQERCNIIADLAWFASRDPRMRRPFTGITELVDYLRSRGASTEAVRTASENWIAWRSSIGAVHARRHSYTPPATVGFSEEGETS